MLASRYRYVYSLVMESNEKSGCSRSKNYKISYRIINLNNGFKWDGFIDSNRQQNPLKWLIFSIFI